MNKRRDFTFEELLGHFKGDEKRLLEHAFDEDIKAYNEDVADDGMTFEERDLVIKRLGPKYPEIVRLKSWMYGV